MNSEQFSELLSNLGACSDARAWARGKDLHTVWTTCERGDWLLWLCGKMVDQAARPTRKELVLATCACAETVLPFVNVGDDRPRLAIETARAWARGEASVKEVKAKAAYYAYYSANSAYYAANSAANSANSAADAADVRTASLARSADIVRGIISEPLTKVAEIESEIAWVNAGRNVEPEACRILDREQAALAEARRGMKEGV